ncbi:hypothetical protein E2C01_063027 [Portunus trituberculatus]|uniref:Uncharacterized protein n=1 Tax=Portunus trituberculatus TaxID=210409 RepID=A0A5B7HHN6_PORTR|nr:hypothetical protein [Portunus trituberculatus]
MMSGSEVEDKAMQVFVGCCCVDGEKESVELCVGVDGEVGNVYATLTAGRSSLPTPTEKNESQGIYVT